MIQTAVRVLKPIVLPGSAPEFSPAPASAAAATGLAGIWVADGTGPAWRLFTNARALPLTAEGLEAAASFDEATSDGVDCVPFSVPMMTLLPDIKQIEVEPDLVRIRGEFDATTRVVHLGARSHAGAEQGPLGHSIGHWEGETLVIDTVSYSVHAQGIATGVTSSPQKHTIERLTLDPGRRSLT